MENIKDYLCCGNIASRKDAIDIRVTSSSDIQNKIITFFYNYPIQGNKYNDFLDFCKVSKLIQNKIHLTE